MNNNAPLLHDMGSSSKHSEQVREYGMIITVTLISRDQTQFLISVINMYDMEELVSESRANECINQDDKGGEVN